MNLKCIATLGWVAALLMLAAPTAFAQCTDLTGVDYHNCECQTEWAKSSASSSCTTTSDGQPSHVRISNRGQNICYVKATCPSGNGTATSAYQGPSTEFPGLKNCNGVLTQSAQSCRSRT